MIKPTTRTPPMPLTLTPEETVLVADYFTRVSNTDQVRTEQRRNDLQNSVMDEENLIYNREREIEELRRSIESLYESIATVEAELSTMPAPITISPEEARADLSRALSLPYIKSVAVEKQTIEGREYSFVVAQTRPNALHTTLSKKFSKNERWYNSKPYTIPLPAYNIRIGMISSSSLAQNTKGLAIALADTNDTAHWLGADRYSHEPHPHWGTTAAQPLEYRAVCLGEFESVVSGAFRKSIAQGLEQLAIYLQSAGAQHAYVHRREQWALWLGKAEYNLVIVPSAKELETLVEADDDENTDRERGCGCMEDSDGDSLCSSECECDCHN